MDQMVGGSSLAQRWWLWLMFLLSLLSATSYAQIPDGVTAAQAPIPGYGHHYIGLGGETVNPAEGSLSFELPIQTPAGRQLQFPFGIRYASSEQFYIKTLGSGSFLWDRSPSPPYEVNGWSYQLPNYSASATTITSYIDPSINDQDINPNYPYMNYCDGSMGYVFRGLDGKQRHLLSFNNWADPDNVGSDGSALCSRNGMGAGGAMV